MEPWFDVHTASKIGGALGGSLGMAGAIIGIFCGLCIRRGCKKLVYSIWGIIITMCAGLLITGIIALITKQPYHVWYSFFFPGLLSTIIFSSLLPVARKRFMEIEMRQMQAKDL